MCYSILLCKVSPAGNWAVTVHLSYSNRHQCFDMPVVLSLVFRGDFRSELEFVDEGPCAGRKTRQLFLLQNKVIADRECGFKYPHGACHGLHQSKLPAT